MSREVARRVPADEVATPDSSPARFLTVDDVAAMLQVRPSTIRQWVRDGRMPCLRLGPRATRWTREMVEEWAASNLDQGRRF